MKNYKNIDFDLSFDYDQSTNEESVELKVGGVYKEVDNVLVAGRIGTISNDDFSLQIFEFFLL